MAESIKEEVIRGRFVTCIFSSGNYAVWRFNDEIDGLITVTGNLSDIQASQDYELFGEFYDHPRFGFQFRVAAANKQLPQSKDGIVAFLSSDIFKGVGKKTATKIVTVLGDETLTKIKEDPDILDEIGISKKNKEAIVAGLNSDIEFSDTFYFLVSAGVGMADINKIINFYKERAGDILKEEPYRMYFEIYGIGFKKCEEIATRLGHSNEEEDRLIALVHHLITEINFRSGDTYTTYEKLKRAYEKEEPNIAFDKALKASIESRMVIVEEDRYYTLSDYNDEIAIATYLLSNNYTISDIDIDEHITMLQERYKISFDSEQRNAIKSFFTYKASIIDGPPGTGKTTIIKAIVDIIKALYPYGSIHVVAPTGRAAKRIKELCSVESSTIHSLLKWDKDSNTFSKGMSDPLSVDFLIIDEFSMVDNWLFHRLIDALGNCKSLCLIGDHHQLPSVRCGNLLEDIVEADILPITYLTNIYRQSSKSTIIELSQEVLKGDVHIKNDNEVSFIDLDTDILRERIVEIISSLIDEGYDVSDIQVLAPMYKGPLGIDALNHLLQDVLNPLDDVEIKNRHRRLRPNDKIIQLKNQRDDDVYNGDIGKIVEIDDSGKGEILCRFDDIYVDYNHEELDNIALAYCISVHKAQGSEYPVVLFVFDKEDVFMLNTNLIYTALSRATTRLYIIGPKGIFLRGVKTSMRKRKTTLKERIIALQNSDLMIDTNKLGHQTQ